jgi:hypothetical protein
MKKTLLLFIALTIFCIPTFFRMLRPGIYSMSDFPYFRIVEYAKCISDAQIPCRWSPDAGLGYGEPIFNFYAPLPFLIGGILTEVGVSPLISLKFLFALSLLVSGILMFLLSQRIWNSKWAGIVSAALYVYAPYRALDVWVRGALSESVAFIFFPLILLCFEYYLEHKSRKWFVFFALSLAGLILTHNLSVLLFAPVLGLWVIVRFFQEKQFKLLPRILGAATLAVLLSAFYLLPAIAESQFVNLDSTTQGYFDFRAHFVTIPQLFLSRFWGYGGSTWGNEDGLSLALGQIQWVLAIVAGICAFIIVAKQKLVNKNIVHVILLSFLTFFALFLTHNKSAFIWEFFSEVMKYIQFPWRFLGTALFSVSLLSGFVVIVSKRYAMHTAVIICAFAVFLNVGFFREDLWFEVTDHDMQTGERWVEQTRASIGDYWPNYGPIQEKLSNTLYENSLFKKTSSMVSFEVAISEDKEAVVPVNYFPGWRAFVDGQESHISYDTTGQVVVPLSEGRHEVVLKFANTPARLIGNAISLVTMLVILATLSFPRKRSF